MSSTNIRFILDRLGPRQQRNTYRRRTWNSV